MADQLTIARPYGRASFEFASTTGAVDAWSRWLALGAGLVGNVKVDQFINNPTLNAERRAQLFCSLLPEEDCGDLGAFRRFVALLAQNNRLATLPEVYTVFEHLKFESQQIQPVEIHSPFELSDAQVEKISASVKKCFGREVSVTVEIDPKLIGGLVVRAGDVVIDGSLSGRLAKLKNTLKS